MNGRLKREELSVFGGLKVFIRLITSTARLDLRVFNNRQARSFVPRALRKLEEAMEPACLELDFMMSWGADADLSPGQTGAGRLR